MARATGVSGRDAGPTALENIALPTTHAARKGTVPGDAGCVRATGFSHRAVLGRAAGRARRRDLGHTGSVTTTAGKSRGAIAVVPTAGI